MNGPYKVVPARDPMVRMMWRDAHHEPWDHLVLSDKDELLCVGTEEECNSFCADVNLRYALWLMVQP